VKEAVTYLDRSFAAQAEASGPFLADQLRLQNLGVYARGGMADAALDSIRVIGERVGDAFVSITALGYLDVASELDSVPMLEQAIVATDSLIARFGLEAVRSLVLRARGRVLELRGRCDEALPLYEQVVVLEPTMYGFEVDVGRCLAATGRLDDAQGRLGALVEKWPAFPRARYELANVLVARGDTAAARSQLARALEIWQHADPAYRPAQKARALDRALGGDDQ
jgi:tetratricopeptide (TPR) repeat protein